MSIARRLARCAACGVVVVSAETLRRQGGLARAWRFQEALQLGRGNAVGAYTLPTLAAAQYAPQQRLPLWPLLPDEDPTPMPTRQQSELLLCDKLPLSLCLLHAALGLPGCFRGDLLIMAVASALKLARLACTAALRVAA